MPTIHTRRSRARHYTPLAELITTPDKQITTLQRCGVYYARLFARRLNITIPSAIVREITGVPPRNQSRILAEKTVRTCHNQVDKGPDPRGRKRALLRSDTRAIADYLSDSEPDIDARGKPWLDIAEAAGVQLPNTYHFNPPGYRTIDPKTIQQSCKRDKGIINAMAEEERDLTKLQTTERLN